MQLEHGGQRLERNAFLRILLAKSLRLVLIVTLQRLLLDVLVQRSVEIVATLNGHLKVVEILVASGHVLHVYAAQVVGELAAEEMRHGSLDACGLPNGTTPVSGWLQTDAGLSCLHLLLQLVHENPVELLDVVLHESVVPGQAHDAHQVIRDVHRAGERQAGSRVPAETFGQLFGADARVAVLQLEEDALQRKWDAILRIFAIRGVHVVDSLQTRAVEVSGPHSDRRVLQHRTFRK